MRGHGDHDLRRLVRRRVWAAVHPGVYVDHTGPTTWQQRAWAAVLATEPSALFGSSALRALDGPGRRGDDDGPVHVAVARYRSLHAPAGDELGVVSALADAVRARLTTADRLQAAPATRTRLPRRALLEAVLEDVAQGTDSVLEHGYLVRVERAHGLPRGARQVREKATRKPRTVYRDVAHETCGVLVELDGARTHETTEDRDLDLARDLDAVVSGRVTVRLGWGQVFRTPCATAQVVGEVLRRRGWAGEVRRCDRCPAPGT